MNTQNGSGQVVTLPDLSSPVLSSEHDGFEYYLQVNSGCVKPLQEDEI